ncbi:HlyD family secretion protein [Oceanimonas sp. CHS3-5]|uniref:HlyD family secretion protein n=1 Tax=Oceanimonas sp. CHS3-5 TaxID=3068186 RepID=UPI00273D2653|nr:HlyD family secretion protein [Oceanimonas sp. CHS3-5]MDP5292930.1 HlyD family secretion protein [Oceanimonas sp. CHS3-5]
MSAEQSFNRWVRIALAAFGVLLVYFVLIDNYAPMTPQAQAHRPVLSVAPRVAGQVAQVAVTNNQPVAAGDLLFALDDTDYRLALARAELQQQLAAADSERQQAVMETIKAEIEQARLRAEELAREASRMERLHRLGHMSVQQAEQARNQAQQARSALQAVEARQQEAEQALAAATLAHEQANNAYKQARLALQRTRVRAELAGRVGNLQLQEGVQARAGQPLLALISNELTVIADLREKSLRHVTTGTEVGVVFDALPGRIFDGHVSSIDSGVRQGQQPADGQLVQPENSDRWVRDAQRLRVHIALDEPVPMLATGARATVQLFPEAGSWLHGLGWAQLWLVSQFRYLY